MTLLEAAIPLLQDCNAIFAPNKQAILRTFRAERCNILRSSTVRLSGELPQELSRVTLYLLLDNEIFPDCVSARTMLLQAKVLPRFINLGMMYEKDSE